MERNTVTHVPQPPGNTTRKCHLPTCIQDEGNDALLLDIQAQHIGAIIGTVCCAAPTCADDAHRINGIGRSVYPVKHCGAWICRLMDVFWTLNRRPHISGFSREQLAPSTHNDSAPEQCMRRSVQDCMAEMVSTPWCRPRYGPLTSVHGCYTMQSSQKHKHKHSGEVSAGSTKTTTGTSSKLQVPQLADMHYNTANKVQSACS